MEASRVVGGAAAAARRRRGTIAVGALAFAVVASVAWPAPVHGAGAEANERERAWYVPDQAKLQLAGNAGFISPGVGWAWRDRQVTADVFFGWVPEHFGGDVYAVTGKVTWRPWAVELGRDLELRPITGALQLTYTFGSDYFVKQPSRYPSGYYEIATAIHSGVAFGSALSWRARNGSRVGVYYELVALDMMLNAWIRNRSSISLDDVFSFAIGASLEF